MKQEPNTPERIDTTELDRAYREFLDVCNEIVKRNDRTGVEIAIAFERVKVFHNTLLKNLLLDERRGKESHNYFCPIAVAERGQWAASIEPFCTCNTPTSPADERFLDARTSEERKADSKITSKTTSTIDSDIVFPGSVIAFKDAEPSPDLAKREAMYLAIQPHMKKIKARYPEELNIEGLEPALNDDVAEVVLEQIALHTKKLRERVEKMERMIPLQQGKWFPKDDSNVGYNRALSDVLSVIEEVEPLKDK